MIHVRDAAGAIAAGLCETVLITHGESGRSGVGRTRNVAARTSLGGQLELHNGNGGTVRLPRARDVGIAALAPPAAILASGSKPIMYTKVGCCRGVKKLSKPPSEGVPVMS
jgi:hypothetical protein